MHSLRSQRCRPQVADQGPRKPEWGCTTTRLRHVFPEPSPLGRDLVKQADTSGDLKYALGANTRQHFLAVRQPRGMGFKWRRPSAIWRLWIHSKQSLHRSLFDLSFPMSLTTSPAHSVCDPDVPASEQLLPKGSPDFELDDKGEYLSDNLHRATPD